MSGTCSNCAHAEKSNKLFYDYECSILTDSFGNAKGVSANGHCDYYLEKATKSNSGYTSGGCYLTSACVEFLGKSDDCEELTKLRTFRDNYMKSTESGRALVEEYYAVAPKIVEAIDSSNDKDFYYLYIYGVITRCIALIEAGDNESARAQYVRMTQTLKEKLL